MDDAHYAPGVRAARRAGPAAKGQQETTKFSRPHPLQARLHTRCTAFMRTQGLRLGRCCGTLLNWMGHKLLHCAGQAHALCGLHDAQHTVCHRLPGAPHFTLQKGSSHLPATIAGTALLQRHSRQTCHCLVLPRHCPPKTIPGLCCCGHLHHPVACSLNSTGAGKLLSHVSRFIGQFQLACTGCRLPAATTRRCCA